MVVWAAIVWATEKLKGHVVMIPRRVLQLNPRLAPAVGDPPAEAMLSQMIVSSYQFGSLLIEMAE